MFSPHHSVTRVILEALAVLVVTASASAVEIRGRVLLDSDPAVGQVEDPVSGARIELFPVLTDYEKAAGLLQGDDAEAVVGQGFRPVAVTRSDLGGYYSLQAPFSGLWRLRVSSHGFVPMECRLPLPEDRVMKPVSLRRDVGRPVRLDGSSETGHLPDVWILAAPEGAQGSSAEEWQPVRSLEWKTARNGNVRVPRAADEELKARVFAPGHESLVLRVPLDDPKAAVRLHPKAVRSLSLRILDPFADTRASSRASDEGGAPVEGALVLLGAGVPGATGIHRQPFPLARTDSDGRAVVRVPRDSTVFLTVLAPDGRRSIRPFEPEPEPTRETAPELTADPIRWSLPPPVSVAGRALDEETGEPIAGALVWFEEVPGSWVRTDAQGLYQLAAPSTAELVLRAEAAFYRGVEIPGRLEGEPLRGGPGASGEEVHEGPLLSLTPVVTLTGRVVDETGQPLVGAEVQARVWGETPGPPPFPVPPVESGQDGVFRFSELTLGVPYRLSARAEGFAPAEVDVPPLEHTAGSLHRPFAEIVLSQGRTVYGTVLDGEGEPVPGAQVTLLWHADSVSRKRFLAGRRLEERVQLFEARTGEGGSFTVIDLPAGHFELVVRAAGFAPYEEPGVEISTEEISKDLGRLELSPGVALEGRVTDPGGRPIPGAEVRLQVRIESSTFPGSATRSGPDGGFRLDHLPPDAVLDLHVRHPDYSTRVLPNITAADQEFLRIELERPAVLTGRVLTASGEPVLHAWVGAKPEDAVDSWLLYSARRGIDATTHTDAEGRFDLPDVEPGRVRLSVEAKGFQRTTRSGLDILPGTETEVDVVLEPGASVTGRVLSADGRPLPGVSVQGGGLHDRTDPEGRFRLAGLSPGPHRLVAWDDEHGRVGKTVEVPPGGTEVDLVFPPGYTVSGRAVGPDDEPISGALVRLEPAKERTRAESSPRSGLTDRTGEFSFPQVPPGSYRVLARREGFAMSRPAPGVEVASGPVQDLRLTLQRGGVVVGQVFGLEPGEAGGLTVVARGAGPVRRGSVRGAGSYRIEGLSPGDWLVTAEVRASGRRAQARVRLRRGDDETQLDLELGEGLTVEGRVRENGSPLIDADVSLFGSRGNRVASVRTDRSGSFRVEGLEPGTYGIEVVSVGRQIRYAETHSIERDRRVDIDLETGSLSGWVVDGGGSPIPGASLLLEPLAGPAQTSAPRWLVTEADGSFTAARLLAGRYRATVRALGGSPESGSKQKEVTISAGAGVEGWMIELPAR